MRHHWRIIKTIVSKRWDLQSMAFLEDGSTPMGWEHVSFYTSRKAAVTVAMIMRERGEPISWEGGPIKIGIAMASSC